MSPTDRERELAAKASRFIKAEAKRAGVGYKELAARLNDAGMQESEDSITSKLARGTFSATFFLATIQALGIEGFRIADL